ncbi:hypothetical protein [Fluviispira multicolorata]|uniref:Uncharacterized protein n=1 Tax=Fluviispira multicolorata TaxID=2654512 RepID=A0A833JF27_9BACT|nr:hypothetical protein [Fluviispira multicolorata]KAB8033516.1 hypothetical protein GCL57_02085 [Fluviispira multicolorata]
MKYFSWWYKALSFLKHRKAKNNHTNEWYEAHSYTFAANLHKRGVATPQLVSCRVSALIIYSVIP